MGALSNNKPRAFPLLVTPLGLKEKKVVLVVYFDITKAFDRVPHTDISVKLARPGIEGNSLGCTKSFLEGRTFQVAYSFWANSLKNTK